ncbi:hypothetical protein SAMN05880582_101815 [Rhizobium sp. RU20A]|uniref:DUF1365 domain-containing protein n=1 Tax=Rhizobium sp. RU20A TaxID=1907412 RepID=UPI000956D038|nr:DUF1365 domain-containing protein [Rhizobium sp. RU20A]SIQ12080.1 hypothetical protein SAMN05880582_101815 [Rhizobium sp. RU20A]
MSEEPTRGRSGADIASNGPPPEAAAAFFDGTVMHQRMKPVGHRFTYDVFSLMVDLDRLEEANGLSRLFSVNRFNLLSFYEKDHGGRTPRGLRQSIDALLAEAGIQMPPARILLVCYPRVLGKVFNPLAVYYAYAADGSLTAVIYEVRNTFGERHTYVCPVGAGEIGPAGLRQSAEKIFHVSPFIALSARYHFRMLPPGKSIRWRILETDAEGPLLSATFAGDRKPLTTGTLLSLVARMPMLTAKIVGAIHWEALKLFLKGVRYIPRPDPPKADASLWKNGARKPLGGAQPANAPSPSFPHPHILGEAAE